MYRIFWKLFSKFVAGFPSQFSVVQRGIRVVNACTQTICRNTATGNLEMIIHRSLTSVTIFIFPGVASLVIIYNYNYEANKVRYEKISLYVNAELMYSIHMSITVCIRNSQGFVLLNGSYCITR